MKKFIFITLFFSSIGFSQEHTLIGGKAADPKDFPASVVASMNGAACTATVVGEKVLFIAAHCVEGSPTATFNVGPNQFSSTCTITPLYERGTDHDLAFCVINRPVSGIPFEMINLDPSLLKVGDTLQLTGFGCTSSSRSGGNDGVYRIGDAAITQLPTGSSFDIVTQGKAALCMGDSGGPAFKYLDAAKTKRVVVSANSKGNISDTSYLASTSTAESISFIKSWAQGNNVKICGVHADATGCRSTSPNGGDDTPASGACAAMAQANAVETWKACLLQVGKVNAASCDKANDLIQNCYATKQ